MTCIVGYIDKEEKTVYIGGDSSASSNSNLRLRKDPKVFIRSPFIIGFTTSFRMGQLLMSDDRFSIRIQKEKESDYNYMVSAFIPAIQKLFEGGGYLNTENGVKSGGNFIIGYKGHLYEIVEDFQVAEYDDDYCACGCGFQYALGSLFLSSEKSVIRKIEKALKAAEYFSPFISSPFKILKLKY